MQANEFLLVDASKTIGVMTQKGFLVLRPSFAAFVPTEAALNALSVVGGNLAWAAAGFVRRVIPEKFENARAYVEALSAESAADFDVQMKASCAAGQWWVATAEDTPVMFKKVPLFSRYKLGFRRDKTLVGPVFGLNKELAERVRPLLTDWKLEN